MLNKHPAHVQIIYLLSRENLFPSHYLTALEYGEYRVKPFSDNQSVFDSANDWAPHCLIIDLENYRDKASDFLRQIQNHPTFSHTQILLLVTNESLAHRTIRIDSTHSIHAISRNLSVPRFLSEIRNILRRRIPAGINFSSHTGPKLTAYVSVELCSAGQDTFSVQGPIKIAPHSKLLTESTQFEDLGLVHCIFRRNEEPAFGVGRSAYINEISVIGVNPDIANRLIQLSRQTSRQLSGEISEEINKQASEQRSKEDEI